MQIRFAAQALAALTLMSTASQALESEVKWQGWSLPVLEQAKRENRFLILDLHAVWCHWCHVMEDTTYKDPKVVSLLKTSYLAVRVDQDANPDLSARYGDWGWPATIIFAPDGSELVKRRGYIPPENMASLLQAVIDDPTPGPSVTRDEDIAPAVSSEVDAATRKSIEEAIADSYDSENSGWGRGHKFIDPDSLDWALRKSERGDTTSGGMARDTLKRAVALIDPVWGGIYQYSDADDWSSPHFEKIMWYQANGLRQYAGAYAMFKDPAYLAAAKAISKFLTTKLQSPDGAFYTSQDADVDVALTGKDFYRLTALERDKFGREPRIDKNLYARENGWAISGLVAFANATGDPEQLTLAKRAASWVLANRLGADGVFRHGATDRGGPFLGDTVAMGTAALDLYAATGERTWIEAAQTSLKALSGFRDPKGGFRSSMAVEGLAGALGTPFKSADEQVQAARLAIRLWRYLGNADAKELAEHGMKYLASPDFVASGQVLSGILLADDELTHEPTHITIVGAKDSDAARTLHAAARMYPTSNKRVDWWDKREGPLPNADITYPDMDQPAAFACGNRLCSLPVFTADALAEVVAQMSRDPSSPDSSSQDPASRAVQ